MIQSPAREPCGTMEEEDDSGASARRDCTASQTARTSGIQNRAGRTYWCRLSGHVWMVGGMAARNGLQPGGHAMDAAPRFRGSCHPGSRRRPESVRDSCPPGIGEWGHCRSVPAHPHCLLNGRANCIMLPGGATAPLSVITRAPVRSDLHDVPVPYLPTCGLKQMILRSCLCVGVIRHLPRHSAARRQLVCSS